MRKRLAIFGFIAGFMMIGVALLYSQPTHAQEGGEDDHHEYDNDVLRGSAVYAEFCAACHGPEGEAIGTDPAFASIRNFDRETLRETISSGYDSQSDDSISMRGYGADANGPLSEEQIDDLIAYINTWNNDLETPPLPESNLEPGPVAYEGPGNPEAGAVVYSYSCLGCHGVNTEGRELASFSGFEVEDTGNLAYLVTTGDGHGHVPGFGMENGGPLTPRQVEDLTAYLQTLAHEEEEEEPEGVSILVIIMGLGAVSLVGAAYMASRRMAAAEAKE